MQREQMITRKEVEFLINKKANITFYDSTKNNVTTKELVIVDVSETVAIFEGDGFNGKRVFVDLFYYISEDNIKTAIPFKNMLRLDLIES